MPVLFAPSADRLVALARPRPGERVLREGRAEALPFADAEFDLVLCQYALMFFTDKAAALAEMRRALAPGGRVLLSVWQGLDRHPFYGQLDRVIERHLGASGVRDIFALGDAEGLRGRMLTAGFSRVEIEPFSLLARFPDPDGFLAGEIDVDTASVPAMQHLDAVARADLVARIRSEMAEALQAVTAGGHVELPFHAHVARAAR